MRASRITFDGAANLAVSHPILGSSINRRRIRFFAPRGGSVTLSNDTPVVDGNGIVLNQGMQAVMFDMEHDGDLVNREWYAIHSAGATPVSWVETIK